MVWARLSPSANSILTRILSYGTKPYSERTARRLRQINGFNAMVVILYGVFAAFYASLDWQALKPQVIAVVATMPLFVDPSLAAPLQ
jgi:adenylate cyclase